MRSVKLIGMATASAALLILGACGGGDDDAGNEDVGAGSAPTDSAPAQPDDAATDASASEEQDACALIPAAEIAEIVGEEVVAESADDGDPTSSACNYEPPGSDFGFVYLTVTWTGGAQEWGFWQAAIGLTDDIWQDTEGVSLDDINVDEAGAVPGLGDRAYYGGILPSLVLSGDVLMEFALPLLPDPEVHFPTLAQSALSRL